MAGKKSQGTTARRRTTSTGGQSSAKTPPRKFGHDYTKDYSDKSWPYHHGKMDRGAKIILILFPLIIIVGTAYVYYNAQLRSQVYTPLAAAKIISKEATAMDKERFWGTYRPNVYFGLKTRSPQSPVAGLMWMTQFTPEMPPSIRHWCEHSDGLPMYGWFVHDGVNFGLQEIVDKYYSLTTDFVKNAGGAHGGDWSARISGNPRPGAEEVVMSMFFYMALDGPGRLEPVLKKERLTSIRGYTEELGNFRLVFSDAPEAKVNYLVTQAPGLDQLKETVMRGLTMFPWDRTKRVEYVGLGGNMMPRDSKNSDPNFVVYQVTVNLPFKLEVNFESGSVVDRAAPLSGDFYQKTINQHLVKFDERFEKMFKLQAKQFSEDKMRFAKAALSNMLGSLGYFYGSSLVRSKYITEQPASYWNAPLFTAVPSRSFFPRGFLWDEGFHNLLLSKWDPRLSMDIIGHWLDLINIEGWIPREQILGVEARAKVPDEFVVQHNQVANPPTLFLPLQSIVKQLVQSSNPADKQYLENMYPRLKVWFDWFNTTQIGPDRSSYQWRGRDRTTTKELNPKTLSSGLDDYPRASHPNDAERHLDLRCWMALASSVMADISSALDKPSAEYKATYEMLSDNKLLDTLHWSEAKQRYSDFGLHTDQVKLERPKPKQTTPGQRPPPPQDKIRVAKQQPKLQFVDSHFGYNSLFPFLLKLVEPNSLKLGKILSDLQDPSLLWTKYGLRSLAKSSPLYNKRNTEHDPPYWRGAVWININYLTLGALYHYSAEPGPYQETAQTVYTDLRTNIIENLYTQYRSTGFIWEHYDDNTGQGKGTHPFTGWSALVVNIMAEHY